MKDDQAYRNPSQHMPDDTEPRRYQNLQHYFANHYNQMLTLLLGFPDQEKLSEVFEGSKNLPESCKTILY